MKMCTKCKEIQPLDNFNTKKGTKKQPHCKECSREEGRARYHSNREENARRANERKNKRMAEVKAYLRELKSSTPCMDCGQSFPWYVMDFDHVEGKKTTEVSVMVKDARAKWRILSEVTKCQIVCANCHRIRTFGRAGLNSEAEMEQQ